MKRTTSLKTAKGEIPVRHARTSTVTAPTVMPEGSMPAIERSILSTLNDMERWMEESFARPFTGLRWTPFRQIFNELGSRSDIAPAVDIFEEGNEVVVKAELPGMTREEVDVRLSGNMLTIAGEKKSEGTIERKDFLRVERTYGSFSRTLRLPEGIRSESAKAHFADGILEIRVPRNENSESVRHIDIE